MTEDRPRDYEGPFTWVRNSSNTHNQYRVHEVLADGSVLRPTLSVCKLVRESYYERGELRLFGTWPEVDTTVRWLNNKVVTGYLVKNAGGQWVCAAHTRQDGSVHQLTVESISPLDEYVSKEEILDILAVLYPGVGYDRTWLNEVLGRRQPRGVPNLADYQY